MQHTYEPEMPESIEFYRQLDNAIGDLLALGARVGITADHGMNAKQKPDGSPNVIYLETALKETFGDGFAVILPITDPYVVHHGALGSFAVVHCPENSNIDQVAAWCNQQEGVTEVLDKKLAAQKLELPEDRMGDLVVMSGRDVVLGRTPAHHDLSALKVGLRSHGGRYEEIVPFVFSHPLKSDYQTRLLGDPRNFEIFDYTINGLQ
jgi:phosphonoacetate hydrolase